MQNSENQKGNPDPCERLLDAAETLFCQKGYEGTSVRDITAEAGCNIAAVNYHFGGKEQLYQEMFRHRLAHNMRGHYETIERVCAGPDPTLEELLRELVGPLIRSAKQQDPWATVIRMMIREAMNHRLDMDKIVGEMKELFFDRLTKAFLQIVPQLDERSAQLAVFSIDALLVHPILFMEYYVYFIPDLNPDEIIEQIVRVGAAGIRSFVKEERA